ncbi:MAG TPA: tRNA preQ1(34) S-adenosylmethionine ribosyltransferase-isomerase QueA [Bryobacteraceae bacterium]|jgi:S-adenosylmethionine:tRNA ribosyltransferase-isomerase|nr:tRNA preQ1(34) S-adenosylmethionine ribosyltransferase-isomerase QueA [Bryobacteraceae bacterium]
MNLAEFDYHLPEELIAQQPLADRSASRMLVLYRAEQRWEDRQFREFPSFLGPGDCLVLNDSRVFPARLLGHRLGVRSLPIGKGNPKRHEYLSGEVEVFLLRPVSSDGKEWEALVRPGRKMQVGERIRFGTRPCTAGPLYPVQAPDGLEGEIVARGESGERTVRFAWEGDLFQEFEKVGHIPLPPYIKRPDHADDRERYQTVFARERGSVAAPTAGLHFTGEILDECRARGAAVAYVTLHVGLGTFQPLHTEQVEQARLHRETYRITEENAALLRAAQRIVAVGTTSIRTIETAWRSGHLTGETDIFLYPGCEFRAAGALLTNFHLPRTSLLLLVCALAGTELALAAYRHAVEARYRFYSYGDCMLIV